MPGIDHDTLELLKEAKSGKRVFFALVVKGGTDGKLLASKSKVSPTQIGEAKKECGGSAVIQGRCHGEDHALVFETVKDTAPAVTTVTKKLLKEASWTVPFEFRINSDAESDAPRGRRWQANDHAAAASGPEPNAAGEHAADPFPAPTDYAADAAAAGESDIGHGRGPAAAATDGRPLDERKEDRNARGRGQDGACISRGGHRLQEPRLFNLRAVARQTRRGDPTVEAARTADTRHCPADSAADHDATVRDRRSEHSSNSSSRSRWFAAADPAAAAAISLVARLDSGLACLVGPREVRHCQGWSSGI